ncbi:hypothetical protein EES40_35755 [Streptomyces sp. ADI93-02]|nr:hypothetical protein EES40_35755 [Streptomyces sp. ADI93-02]
MNPRRSPPGVSALPQERRLSRPHLTAQRLLRRLRRPRPRKPPRLSPPRMANCRAAPRARPGTPPRALGRNSARRRRRELPPPLGTRPCPRPALRLPTRALTTGAVRAVCLQGCWRVPRSPGCSSSPLLSSLASCSEVRQPIIVRRRPIPVSRAALWTTRSRASYPYPRRVRALRVRRLRPVPVRGPGADLPAGTRPARRAQRREHRSLRPPPGPLARRAPSPAPRPEPGAARRHR